MSDFIIRPATAEDAPFLAETIIEAEKSGTDKLSYATVFGLAENDVQKYLVEILEEEIDGCELSVSSFLVADFNGEIGGAICGWVEGNEDLPSAIIKSNLITYTFPKECIEKAMNLNTIIREVHIDYIPKTIHMGACFVAEKYRGNRLLATLMDTIMQKLLDENPKIDSVCVHVFDSNIPSLRTCEKLGFKIMKTKEAANSDIKNYLPSHIKHLLIKKFD